MAPSKDRKPEASGSQPRVAPTFSSTAPAFLSSLRPDEIDFPRGGGTSLTPLEIKQIRAEGKREADDEAAAEASKRPAKRSKRGVEREGKKRKAENESKGKELDKDVIRIEQLNYKRLSSGTRLLTRVHSILPLHLILSLPNGLLAHVPITEVSTTLTKLLAASSAGSGAEADEDEDDESDTEAPELNEIFHPGQYLTVVVLTVYPTASQTFVNQYPMTETTKLAAKVECSLIPEKVNAEAARKDVDAGYVMSAEIKEEEDKGYRLGLGLASDSGPAPEGWLSKEDAGSEVLTAGQVVSVLVTSVAAGGRVIQVSRNLEKIRKAQLSEVSTVESLLPGHAVSALITAVVGSGLNVKVCGFFDGTIDGAHLPLEGKSVEDKYKVGKRIRCRILYDNLSVSPRRFVLSALPQVLNFSSPTLPGDSVPVEEAIAIGKTVNSVKITRVIPEWGAFCRSDDGLEGFVHISHVSDEHVAALSSTIGPYRIDTIHRARVIGHSPLDGVVQLSLAQSVLDQAFMQVGELQVGQQLKGKITRLTDKALFIDVSGSVSGVVFPAHYADIQLKHPEKRFKPGASVRCRVWQLDASRNRVLLTLKKSLIDSEFAAPADFNDVQPGQITHGVIVKLMEKGCLVELWGGMRAFVPISEAHSDFVQKLSDLFFIGKSVKLRITEKHADTGKLLASIRQASGEAAKQQVSTGPVAVGDVLSGTVKAIHSEQVVITVPGNAATALLALSNLAKYRKEGIEDVRATLRVGETLEHLRVTKINSKSGALIVAIGGKSTAKKDESATAAPITSGSVEVGQVVQGTVSSTAPSGIMVSLPGGARGRIHPCDAADDFSLSTKAGSGDRKEIRVYVLAVHTKPNSIDLSTRPSRINPKKADAPVDPEIDDVKQLSPGQKIRGLIRNVAPQGLFVSLGRNIAARVKIRELFDDFVQDWQPRFAVGQVVSGVIIAVDTKAGQVELSLRSDRLARGAKDTATARLSDFAVGQKVDAVVKRVEAYGLFLRIDGTEVSGLCHKSELSDNKKQDVSMALKGFREGDRVRAVLKEVDTGKNRVGFSIKASHFADEFGKPSDRKGEDESDDGGMDEDQDGDDDDAMDGEDGMMDDDEDEDSDADDDGQDGGSEEDEDRDEGEEEDADIAAEDGMMDEDESEDDDDEEDDDASPPTALPAAKGKVENRKSTLSLNAGFDWSGHAVRPADDTEESDESEDEDAAPGPSSKPAKTAILSTLNSTDVDSESRPSSATEFERALLSSPNSSFLWIQYMSFLLQLHEVDRARSIGRQALEKIAYREEEEKLNVWMALVNLELAFGTQEQVDKVFKEASERNEKREVYQRYADALVAAGKDQLAEEVLKKLVKKFSANPDAWAKHAEFYLERGDLKSARDLLPRSMQSLDKTKHVVMIEKMALLEFKHGEAERGKTLFEGLIDRYPKRLDLWNVYVDQLVKAKDIGAARMVIDRALDAKLTTKRAKFVFKKWLSVEQKVGDEKGEEKAKERARDWVATHAKEEDDE